MSASESAEIFRIEAQELIEQLEQILLDLERSPEDPTAVAKAFRCLHTLKGSGAMFGFEALSRFAHRFETAFDRLRKGTIRIRPALIAVSLKAVDALRQLSRDVAADDSLHAALLGALDAAVSAEPAKARWHIRFSFPPEALKNGTRPLALIDELRELGQAEVIAIGDRVPLLDDLRPDGCYLAWEVTLTSDRPRADIDSVFEFTIDDMTLEVEEIVAPSDPVPDTPDATAAATPKPGSKYVETLRVSADRLDDLMNYIGELVITQSRLKQVAKLNPDTNLRAVSEDIARLSANLRDLMMTVRMVPIAQLFGRFRRQIQDLARETGKKIEFVTEGEATELDKTVIERLADPLIHIIRNAADHGLETPEQRRAAGKPEAGRLSLSARQTGTEVVIAIGDDGRGIDRVRVRAKAEEQGLIAPGAEISDHDLMMTIFQPGFSTAGNVTSLSGRGVGMDVVKRTIETLRGGIDIESTPGKGCKISLRIPVTLAIIDGLLVRVDDTRYVIPLAAVEECLEMPLECRSKKTGCNLLNIRDQLIPVVCLRKAFGFPADPSANRKLVVVAAGDIRIALIVDHIDGSHQTVIKPLSPFHARIGAFTGATILGDGSVALIVNAGHFACHGNLDEERRLKAG